MAKYDPLRAYLRRKGSSELVLSFTDIERLILAMLPKSASRSQWWGNETEPGSRHVQSHAWRGAGYEASLMPEGDRVRFSRRR